MKWLLVELTTSGELAEPVAELFSRHAPGGASLTSTEEDKGHAVSVRAYLPHDDTLDQRKQAIKEGLWHLGQIQPLPEARFQPLEAEDWSESWKQHYRPLTVGRRFLVLPAWLEAPPTDRMLLCIDPGMAFGTGSHPSTQLCMELLEAHFTPDQTVVDIGCGSGILSIAAVRLGAARVLALDIEAEAVKATRSNARLNNVETKLEVVQGSLRELEARRENDFEPSLIIANILAPVLQSMLDDGLAGMIQEDAGLILGGILEEQAADLVQAGAEHGLTLVETRAEEDWRALLLKRNPPPKKGSGPRSGE